MSSIAASPGVANLPDGAEAVVTAPDDDADLSPADLAELEEADAEIERGEYVTADDVLRRLDERAARAAP